MRVAALLQFERVPLKLIVVLSPLRTPKVVRVAPKSQIPASAEHSALIGRVLDQGLSRSAYLLVKGSGPAPSQTRNLNDLAGSRSPVPGPEMRFT